MWEEFKNFDYFDKKIECQGEGAHKTELTTEISTEISTEMLYWQNITNSQAIYGADKTFA